MCNIYGKGRQEDQSCCDQGGEDLYGLHKSDRFGPLSKREISVNDRVGSKERNRRKVELSRKIGSREVWFEKMYKGDMRCSWDRAGISVFMPKTGDKELLLGSGLDRFGMHLQLFTVYADAVPSRSIGFRLVRLGSISLLLSRLIRRFCFAQRFRCYVLMLLLFGCCCYSVVLSAI
ncbi:hypothetical protein L6452_32482 [Arctium lappa]|uniref:Uncharacterized protein n=1 Tax=Arctium lappa TaxID=4217 RepID=A0ACB8Z4N6_ARCLA|nr:hypothetical protein L6452_32482 [Arctium lappa]